MPLSPDEFARLLSDASGQAQDAVRPVVEKGALNVKNEARKNVSVSAPIHNAHAQYTITYDMDDDGLGAEIGYDLRVSKAANIAWVLEYGGGGDHSPPHRDLGRALDDEEPKFEQAIADVVGKLL